jgi:phosphoribosylanthranilate isomerase
MQATEIKICGLGSLDDARAALDMGADYLGFILYPKSPRAITAMQLATIRDALPESARCVGVFVNSSREDVAQIAADCRLDIVQIHGDEQAADFADFPVTVWRAVHVSEGACRPAPEEWPAARYLVDAAPPGVYGGSGQVADWEAATRLAAEQAVMLAGGLTPDNVADAIHAVQPVGVDVASGVEARPGVKDLDKVRRFIANAKAINERNRT